MSSDRIARLHEAASEQYLNGDYRAALQSWKDVLALDPSDGQALEGIRMASQFAEPASNVEQDLDDGLKVFDSLGGPARQTGPAVKHDPNSTMVLDRGAVDRMLASPTPSGTAGVARQGDGIDFGDLSHVGAIPLGDPGATDRPPAPEPAESWQAPAEAEPSFGLEPAAAHAPETDSAPSAAAIELKRRVDDLLAQARTKAEAGELDEARAILVRVTILDEDNAEAAQLREQWDALGSSQLDRIEQAIIEGVSAMESDRLDEAETRFREALALAPEHREALHYLEQVEARRTGAAGAASHGTQGDLLGAGVPVGDLPEKSAAPPPAAPASTVPLARPGGRSGRSSAALPAPAPAAPARRKIALSPRMLLFGGLAAIAVVCGLIALPLLRGERGAPKPSTPVVSGGASAKKDKGAAPAAPKKPALDPATLAREVAANLEHGRTLAGNGDYAGAIVAFNAAAELDPANLDARAGLADAVAHYKERKAEQDTLEAVAASFKEGEYASALRSAYRLPPTVDAARVERMKVAGWYDLAIVALRAGDCRTALGHLDEALNLAPNDAEAKKLKDFATRYLDAAKDRGFLDTVEALPFRPFPQ